MDYSPSKRIEREEPVFSPSGHYSLVVEKYRSIPPAHPASIWEIYTRGIVYEDGREILTIDKENYDLWHYWLEHPRGEYLLCGCKANNLYQINLKTREEKMYDLKYWVPVFFYPSPDKTKLAVVGSDYWDQLRIFTIDQDREPDLTNSKYDDNVLLWADRTIEWIDNETLKIIWHGENDDEFKSFAERTLLNYPIRIINDRQAEIMIKC